MSEFKLIKCGKMYDGKSDTLQENMEILVNGTMIEEVGKKLTYPLNTTVLQQHMFAYS